VANGSRCKIERSIIDKNVQIGEGVTTTNKRRVPYTDEPNYYIRDGIVIIPKNSVIAAGAKI